VADEIPDYLVGDKGVNIVASPIHTPEHGLLEAQNVEFKRLQGIGGLGSRDGIAPLNTAVLNGQILSMIDVPLDTSAFGGGGGGRALGIYLGVAADMTGRVWLYSTDGAVFTDVDPATFSDPSITIDSPSAGRQIVSRSGVLYFGSGAALFSWDGKRSVARVAAFPDGGNVQDLFVADGGIYVMAGGTTPIVYFFQPATGSLTQIVNTAAFNPAGAIANLMGFLWLGGQYNSGGVMLRQEPNGSWFQYNATAGKTYLACAAFGASVYVGEWQPVSVAGNMHILRSDAVSGPLVSDFFQPVADVNAGWEQFFAFGGLLFATFRDPNNTISQIYSTATPGGWALESDIVVDFSESSGAVPGPPFVFGGDLYWPYKGGANGFLLKRSAGVWSEVFNATALTGCGGVVS
jgi:hypothetical protein